MKQEELETSLSELKLYVFQKNYSELAKSCLESDLGHVDYLSQLTALELEDRYQKRIQRLLKKSKIPKKKDIQDFDVSRIPGLNQTLIKDFCRGKFIDRGENLLIFGNPGTGKTHLAISLTREWCFAGRKALFLTAAELIQELLKAKSSLRLTDCIQKYSKYEVLVIDDISYVACERQEADLLFHLLSNRYETKSVVITSNLSFGEWGKIFKDEMTTTATIDRLVHHATLVKLDAESYRKASAEKKLKEVKMG